MKIIGLTGGIGSGKSTVLKEFASKGIPCYEADKAAKKLMHQNKELIHAIKETFGEAIYKEGQLDRKKLAAIVFSDKEKLAKLNTLVHPVVTRDFESFISKQNAPYVIKEAAILFESGGYKNCDRVILITAPPDIRLERVKKRDKTDEQEVLDKMRNQWEDERKIPLADYVIENTDWQETKRQIDQVHRQFSLSLDN